MSIALLTALALAAQPTAPTGEVDAWLIADCRLARVDMQTLLPANETSHLALLLRVPQGARGPVDARTIQVFDPDFLLGSVPFSTASFGAASDTMSAQSRENLPIVYRFNAAPGLQSGAWRAGLRMQGRTAAGEAYDRSYMGHCTMSQPGDAVAQFEGLGSAQ